eukprot:m.79750 g.79750  ORF g.79750 m.79750 type:complete len:793 (-) comp11988_c0_seq1:23-2401(-)
MGFHCDYTQQTGFFTWDELSCLARCNGFKGDLFERHFSVKRATQLKGLTRLQVDNLYESGKLDKDLHKSVNFRSATTNFLAIKRTMRLVSTKKLTFQEIYDAKVAFDLYDHEADHEGIFLRDMTQVSRALKLSGRVIAPSRLQMQIKRITRTVVLPSRLQLADFLVLVAQCQRLSEVNLEREERKKLKMKKNRLYDVDDFHAMLVPEEKQIKNKLDAQSNWKRARVKFITTAALRREAQTVKAQRNKLKFTQADDKFGNLSEVVKESEEDFYKAKRGQFIENPHTRAKERKRVIKEYIKQRDLDVELTARIRRGPSSLQQRRRSSFHRRLHLPIKYNFDQDNENDEGECEDEYSDEYDDDDDDEGDVDVDVDEGDGGDGVDGHSHSMLESKDLSNFTSKYLVKEENDEEKERRRKAEEFKAYIHNNTTLKNLKTTSTTNNNDSNINQQPSKETHSKTSPTSRRKLRPKTAPPRHKTTTTSTSTSTSTSTIPQQQRQRRAKTAKTRRKKEHVPHGEDWRNDRALDLRFIKDTLSELNISQDDLKLEPDRIDPIVSSKANVEHAAMIEELKWDLATGADPALRKILRETVKGRPSTAPIKHASRRRGDRSSIVRRGTITDKLNAHRHIAWEDDENNSKDQQHDIRLQRDEDDSEIDGGVVDVGDHRRVQSAKLIRSRDSDLSMDEMRNRMARTSATNEHERHHISDHLQRNKPQRVQSAMFSHSSYGSRPLSSTRSRPNSSLPQRDWRYPNKWVVLDDSSDEDDDEDDDEEENEHISQSQFIGNESSWMNKAVM